MASGLSSSNLVLRGDTFDIVYGTSFRTKVAWGLVCTYYRPSLRAHSSNEMWRRADKTLEDYVGHCSDRKNKNK